MKLGFRRGGGMNLIQVAIRNVGRNKRRSFITMLTVFLGVVVSTLTRGLLDGLQGEIKSNLTRKMYGDLQVHRKGYQDTLESQPYKLLIPQKIQNLTWDQAPRLKVMALVNHQKSQSTTPVMITGIDSTLENIVCPRFMSAVQTGKMLDSTLERGPVSSTPTSQEAEDLGEASGLGSQQDDQSLKGVGPRAEGFQQILLTPSLVRGMGAEVGDEMIVLIADKDNMQQAIIARLVGVIDLGIPGAAARMAWMDLAQLQKTLNVQGQASEIAIRLPVSTDLRDGQNHLLSYLGADQMVETWEELGGFLRDAMALQNVVFTAVVGIMFAIVMAAIVNTSLMTVMERTREIGSLMALGYRRKHILTLFLVESAVIGGLGGVLGLMTGVFGIGILNFTGISLKLPGQVIATTLYPTVSLTFLCLLFSLAVGSALLAGFIPAHRASHLKPVDALTST